MHHSLPTFHVMPAGWDHPGWTGGFYPDDLPEDWRLSYFSNEFSEVLVPRCSWQEADPDELQGWVDDVSAAFRFYLELQEPVEASLCAKRVEMLGGNFGGFVLTKDVAGKDLSLQMNTMAHGYTGKIYLLLDPGFPVCVPKLNQGLGVGLALSLSGKVLGKLPAQREFLEKLQDQIPVDAQVLLCFIDTTPPVESIKGFRQLAELMGLA